MNRINLICLSVVVTVLLSFTGCQTSKNIDTQDLYKTLEVPEICWNTVNPEIQEFFYRSHDFKFHALKINLKSSKIDFFTRETSSSWENSVSVRKFAQKTNAIAAINTNPFKIKNKYSLWGKVIPVGLNINNKTIFSKPCINYSALCLTKKSKCWNALIIDSQDEINKFEELPDVAAGGFWTVLKDGNIIPFKNIKDFRSGSGISEDGNYLFLYCGENLSYEDCAYLIKKCGAYNAMNFDGGSSSSLVLRNKQRITQLLQRNVISILAIKYIDEQ